MDGKEIFIGGSSIISYGCPHCLKEFKTVKEFMKHKCVSNDEMS